ncbi:MAG: biotin--[acetyl-CoA-carboxylase] ligase [Actinobacteria bacterium]|nr:biotin--[acetyl-CoA-carboxylase] ligase [Actinomycetota bacterium]
MEKRMPADLLDASAISHALTGSYWRVSTISEATSTQELLRTSNPSHGDVLATEFQSAGRGRLDRSFEAERSTALLFSLFIKPRITQERWSFIPLLAGLSVVQVLNSLCESNKFFTKWPNDILINEKKISGMISEVCGDGIIVGIGINTTMSRAQLPVSSATSVLIELGIVLNRNELLAEILRQFSQNLADWESGRDFLAEYTSLSSTINREVKAIAPDGVEAIGTALGVDESGALLLSDQQIIRVGDLLHLR